MPEENSRYISTRNAAEALGVGVSTVKRWVDDGILPAHRTAGGHRKLLRAEVLALARQGQLPHLDLTGLNFPSSGRRPTDFPSLAAALLAALLGGDGIEAGALLRRAYHAGAAIEILTDQVISPVMAEVGRLWESARITIWEEHRATQLCAAALYDMKEELEVRAERQRPTAVGAAPEGDPYVLASLLAQMVLLDAGWAATNLGPNTPLASLTEAVRELRPRLVWLSVSHLEKPADFLQEYRAFYQAAETVGAAVAVGGQALVEGIRSRMMYTTFGDGLNHLAAFARTLHRRPKPPRRGRPPKN
jgi:excisionase family DNA binding protein